MATANVFTNSTTTDPEPPAMTLTPVAEAKLRELMHQRNIPNYGLRVFVTGGGCSGLQYGMVFEAQPRRSTRLWSRTACASSLTPPA